MDVKRGHCWRCDKSTDERSDVCSLCKIATYCSVKCCQEDQYRHKPECEVWGTKKCNNPQCSESGHLKECSGCNDAWYCGQKCQQTDRNNHKRLCQKRVKGVKDAAAKKRDYYRDRSGGPFSRPYFVGNNLAIDMLNIQENECSDLVGEIEREANLSRNYNIISAGCGNLRNVIITATSLPGEFVGKVRLVLNDFDPFVQARNVMFLYMMIAFATHTDLATMLTTIWYSLRLSSKDYKFLTDCLKTLTRLTGPALLDATRGLVMVPEEYMRQLREVWRGWLELQCQRNKPNFTDLQKQRQTMFEVDHRSMKFKTLFTRQAKKWSKSAEEWLENGIFQPSIAANQCNMEYDNPTLTGYNFMTSKFFTFEEAFELLKSPRHHKFIYCVSPNLTPFGEWDQLLVQKHKRSKSLVVLYHSYITGQIQHVIELLKDRILSFNIHVCNCIDMVPMPEPEAKFDRIFTSNIADYQGTQTLLRVFKPLLKKDNTFAVIVTQYLNWYSNGFPEATLEDNPEKAVGGTYKACLLAAKNDTGRKDLDDMLMYSMKGNAQFCMMDNATADIQSVIDAMSSMGVDEHLVQEYFNIMVYFVSHMRADFMASDPSIPLDKAVPFQRVLHTEGLRMRDFRSELNRVVPFAYRRNIRPVNLLRGMDRMVEWRLPE